MSLASYRCSTPRRNHSPGNGLLSQRVAPLVPSALAGLTSGFGMGPGVSPPLESPGEWETFRFKKHTLTTELWQEGQVSGPGTSGGIPLTDHFWGGSKGIRLTPGDRPRPALPRKEVIQPQLPLRLPCYDFVPVAGPAFDGSFPPPPRVPRRGEALRGGGLGHRLQALPTPMT